MTAREYKENDVSIFNLSDCNFNAKNSETKLNMCKDYEGSKLFAVKNLCNSEDSVLNSHVEAVGDTMKNSCLKSEIEKNPPANNFNSCGKDPANLPLLNDKNISFFTKSLYEFIAKLEKIIERRHFVEFDLNGQHRLFSDLYFVVKFTQRSYEEIEITRDTIKTLLENYQKSLDEYKRLSSQLQEVLSQVERFRIEHCKSESTQNLAQLDRLVILVNEQTREAPKHTIIPEIHNFVNKRLSINESDDWKRSYGMYFRPKKFILEDSKSDLFSDSPLSKFRRNEDLTFKKLVLNDEVSSYVSKLNLRPYLRDMYYPDDDIECLNTIFDTKNFFCPQKASFRENCYELQSEKGWEMENVLVDLSDLSKPFQISSSLKMSSLIIGKWESVVETYAKFYHSKKKIVCIFTDIRTSISSRIVVEYADVSRILVYEVINKHDGDENLIYIASSFFLNGRPKLQVEVPNVEDAHMHVWEKAEKDFTNGAATVLPLALTMVFERSDFIERNNSNVSHLEMLVLGDPYFAEILRIDNRLVSKFGLGLSIVGRRSMAQLRDKLLAFLNELRYYLDYNSAPKLSLSLNFDVHHRFKFIDHSRGKSDGLEPSIAIKFDNVYKILSGNNVSLITKEEIQYFMQITKIGETGISGFRVYKTKSIIDSQSETQTVDKDLLDMQQKPAQAKKEEVKVIPKRSRGRPQKLSRVDSEICPKNIRVAMIFSKSRLISICGEEVSRLWNEAKGFLEIHESDRIL